MSDTLIDELRQIIAEVTEVEDIPEDTLFADLGIDSMMAIEIVADVEKNYEITIEEGAVEGKMVDGSDFTTYVPAITEDLLTTFDEQAVKVTAQPKDEGSFWRQLLIMWFPLVLFIGLWIFFIRQMQSGGGKAMSFGKSRARLLTENQHQVTFEDVAGVEESKVELEEIIAFLKEPKKFTRLGGRIPKGVLLVGPPGTGKTLLGRAVAGLMNLMNPSLVVVSGDLSRLGDLLLDRTGSTVASSVVFWRTSIPSSLISSNSTSWMMEVPKMLRMETL